MNPSAPIHRSRRRVRLGLLSFVLAAVAIFANPSISWGHAFLTTPISLTVRNQVVTGTATVDALQLTVSEQNQEGIDLTKVQKLISIRVNDVVLPIKVAWTSETFDKADPKNQTIVFVTEAFEGELHRIDVRWNFSSPSKQVLLQTDKTSMIAYLNEKDLVSFNISFWDSAGSYFYQGVGHIVFGLDHLLFLIVLGLGLFKRALNRKSAVRAIGLVGAFTLGHALSFTLSYFGLMSFSTTLVEPVIALSIFAAAVGALTKWQWEKYWGIATLIGLVHGLGFASSLAQMGLATSQHAVAIVTFNLGIDLAQTCVVALTAMSLWVARNHLGHSHELLRRLVLVAIAGVALFWTITRMITG
ncbi:MAG: hypothetical protein RLZZ56_182 [Actinomycetota bacterium]